MLALGGVTLDIYLTNCTTNSYGFDPVDLIILKAARNLDNRHFRVFGLLYEGHRKEEILDRLKRRGHKSISPSTLDRYRVYIENRIVELIETSPQLMKQLMAELK